MSDSEASDASDESTVAPASDDSFAPAPASASGRTVVVDALNYLGAFVPNDESAFADASAPVLFAEAEDRVRAVAEAARVASLELIWVFDNGQATEEAKEKWLVRRLDEVKQARRDMPCSADTVLHALLQRAGFTVLYPPGIDGDDAVALIAWKLGGDALSRDRDLLRYEPELPRSRVYRGFAIDDDSGRLVLEPQGAPLPKGTAPRSLRDICKTFKWPGPMQLSAQWGMNEPALCANARSGTITRGNPDSFTAAHGNLHVDAMKLYAAVFAQLGLTEAVTVRLPEAVDDASGEEGDAQAALVARAVLPDDCTAKRIVASSAKLARRWLYGEASLPDTPDERRERAHAVCMIAAETVNAMWFAQGVNRCVARGALYRPAVRTLTLYNKLASTDPHLWDDANDANEASEANEARGARGGTNDWCALMRCKGLYDRRTSEHAGCIGSGYAFPSKQRNYALARGKYALCPECVAKLRAGIRGAP